MSAEYEITWRITCSGDDAALEIFNAIKSSHDAADVLLGTKWPSKVTLTKIIGESNV